MRTTFFITLGSGATGSSAIEDYLLGRGDIKGAPLNQEFRLIQDPGGISDLYAAICSEFHMNRASGAIEAFLDLCDRCGRAKSGYPKGLNYRKTVDKYDDKVQQYINKIVEVSYSAMPFCERSKLSKFQSYIYERKRKKAKRNHTKPDVGNVRLPVTEERFLKETTRFLELLLTDGKLFLNKPILVEQGGSFWAPVSSTKYYGSRKVIVVTRDPRDIFSEILHDGYAYPGRDVELFCSWFDNMMSHVKYDEWEDDCVIHIKFESFVNNYKEEKTKLDSRLEISESVESSYNPNKSAKNIGKYKNILTNKESNYIEERLKDYLHY
jgi:hypothetical protein